MSQANFKVDDLVFAMYDNIGEGTIYRVTEIEKTSNPRADGVLKLKPIFCLQGPEFLKNKRTRKLGAGWARKVKAEDLREALSNLDGILKELETK